MKDKNLLVELKKVHNSMVKEGEVEEKAALEEKVKELLSEIFLSIENIPQLRENEDFLHLRYKLLRLEKQIGIELIHYLKLVRQHNKLIKSIPIVFFRQPSPFREDEALLPKGSLY